MAAPVLPRPLRRPFGRETAGAGGLGRPILAHIPLHAPQGVLAKGRPDTPDAPPPSRLAFPGGGGYVAPRQATLAFPGGATLLIGRRLGPAPVLVATGPGVAPKEVVAVDVLEVTPVVAGLVAFRPEVGVAPPRLAPFLGVP